jgi:signal transduction histidine kinase
MAQPIQIPSPQLKDPQAVAPPAGDRSTFLRQGILYSSLLMIVSGGYALIVSGISLLLGGVWHWNNPWLMGGTAFVVALLLAPLRTRLGLVIDQVLLRRNSLYPQRLQQFSRELGQAVDVKTITRLLRNYALQDLQPQQAHLFLYDPFRECYTAIPDGSGRSSSDLRFAADSSLVLALRQSSRIILPDTPSMLPLALQGERSRLQLLQSQLFLTLPGQQRLIGWLSLAPRQSGEAYLNEDIDYLENLCSLAANALDRSQVVADLEQRVRELDVLTRVAQGTNSTIVFDDLLELVYAQTNQVVPTRDFHITLLDQTRSSLAPVFYLENDERLDQMENQSLPADHSLEADVIASQHPIYTVDYELECRNRGFFPAFKGIYAWIGVPMNAGAETIGVISLGSRDPAALYTSNQRNLLQAIADQASGAIVKARLLDETEQRARQLAILNEIGRSLTSTLEQDKLLSQILRAGTKILNCDAGVLYLVDRQTRQATIANVVGPLAPGLVGRHFPVDVDLGAAGFVVLPLVEADLEAGFVVRDTRIAPMLAQDQVIGAIQLINRRDGHVFNRADDELLTTFTSQAAIAIENARLYTMTDQALAARVDEMAAMQRIDRELNASLELDRALRITLEWAMHRSRAAAGLVAIVGEAGLGIMASQGYEQELETLDKAGDAGLLMLPTTMPGVQLALETGQPQSLSQGQQAAGANFGLLTGANEQQIIPICREKDVIGLLLLESHQAFHWPEDILAFLSRLSDHAAIAIANAQLYEEVRSANLAKSKFVSFVAHELKNPMASIKGYTELVITGMAGPVNDMQKSFLSTVRSNVDRMNTIVSDLNDLTKIQIGNLRLEHQAVKVREVVDEVLRSMRRQIEEKEQVLTVQFPDALPTVWADPLRLAQVLTNLVSNAQKYTHKTGVIVLGAEVLAETEQTAVVPDYVHIWVQDSGIGISAEDQGNIFEQYFRTEHSKEVASGTGLGLNITKSLVEMQGGRIWFESQLGQGTTFHITIPIAETN